MKVYFIKPRDADGPIKVGIASELEKRFGSLCTGSPVALEIITTVDGDLSLERQFHALFMPHRSHGEWFHAAPLVVETVAAVKAGTFDYNGLPAPVRIKAEKRSNDYMTPQWQYARSVAARLNNLSWRGIKVDCDARAIEYQIKTATDDELEGLKAHLEPQLAAIYAQHPTATQLKRRRKVTA